MTHIETIKDIYQIIHQIIEVNKSMAAEIGELTERIDNLESSLDHLLGYFLAPTELGKEEGNE